MSDPRMSPERLARIIDHDRAVAVSRWADYGMTAAQIAELASSWDKPDDTSPYFGNVVFGQDVCDFAARLLRRPITPTIPAADA